MNTETKTLQAIDSQGTKHAIAVGTDGAFINEIRMRDFGEVINCGNVPANAIVWAGSRFGNNPDAFTTWYDGVQWITTYTGMMYSTQTGAFTVYYYIARRDSSGLAEATGNATGTTMQYTSANTWYLQNYVFTSGGRCYGMTFGLRNCNSTNAADMKLRVIGFGS